MCKVYVSACIIICHGLSLSRSTWKFFFSLFFSLPRYFNIYSCLSHSLREFWRENWLFCFRGFSILNQHLSFSLIYTCSFFLLLLSTSSYRTEIVKRRERERVCVKKKVSSSYSCCPWKKNCFLAEQTYISLAHSLLSIPFTAAVATAYACSLQCPFSLSPLPLLSLVYNGITRNE